MFGRGWRDGVCIPILKERKVTSVIGWADRRQLRVPGVGLSRSAIAG